MRFICLVSLLLFPAVARAGDEEDRLERLEERVKRLETEKDREIERLRAHVAQLEKENARLRVEGARRERQRSVEAVERLLTDLSERADLLSAQLVQAREKRPETEDDLEAELHMTREAMQTATEILDVRERLGKRLGSAPPDERKALVEIARTLDLQLKKQVRDFHWPWTGKSDDLFELMARALLHLQEADLRKSRDFFAKRLAAMKAALGGKEEGTFEETTLALGTSPEAAKRLSKIVKLIDEALARHEPLRQAETWGPWSEKSVIELFKLKARIDRQIGEEFEKFVEAMQAWAQIPDERPVAFAEIEEEIKEEPVTER
ncbi:MAG: hypothetical protein O7E54_03920 [Planctomycetota bacterium]|nr:hypothetical protein [Planctomycetota bacterium]